MLNIQDLIAQIQQQQYARMPPSRIPTPGVPQNLPTIPGLPNMGNHMVQPGSYGAQAQGLLGAQQQPQAPQPGPYGAQAQQLAGLLGGQGAPPMGMAPPYRPGLFMPGFRPGIDQPAQGNRSQGSPARRVRPY